MMVVTNTLKR